MRVNFDTFLTGESIGQIELINKTDLTCLSALKLKGVQGIY